MRNPVAGLRRLPLNWTTLAPAVCAVHCAATPVLVAVAPALVREAAVEWTLLAVTVGIAAYVLTKGLRSHGRVIPGLLAAAGIGLWAASLLGVFEPVPEDVSTPIVALITAGGLLWNARLHHDEGATGCSCSAG